VEVELVRSAHSSTRPDPGLGRTARLAAIAVGAAVVTTAVAVAATAPTQTSAQSRAQSQPQALARTQTRVQPTSARAPAAAARPKVHVVKQGESLSSIAKTAGVSSWKRLYDANRGVRHPDTIHPGQRLVIPDAKAKLRSRPLPGPVVTIGGGASTAARTYRVRARSSARSSGSSYAGSGVWDRLAACESGGNWGINTGNGYSGGLQFSPGTWRAHGGSGSAHNASRAEQIRVATRVQRSQGWGAWPACSAKLGLR
jgi:LysM repeat protein